MGGKGIRRNSEIHLWLEKNYVRLICGVKSLNKINTRCDAVVKPTTLSSANS